MTEQMKGNIHDFNKLEVFNEACRLTHDHCVVGVLGFEAKPYSYYNVLQTANWAGQQSASIISWA